jgi:hypothetical protein
MHGWMDGWMDGWMGGWMDGWMDHSFTLSAGYSTSKINTVRFKARNVLPDYTAEHP